MKRVSWWSAIYLRPGDLVVLKWSGQRPLQATAVTSAHIALDKFLASHLKLNSLFNFCQFFRCLYLNMDANCLKIKVVYKSHRYNKITFEAMQTYIFVNKDFSFSNWLLNIATSDAANCNSWSRHESLDLVCKWESFSFCRIKKS